MIRVHGSSVNIEGRGVLLTGPSGAGKSNLTLRLIDGGAQLISDDYTDVRVREGQALLSPPAEIAGLLEVRGLGLMKLPHCDDIPLHIVFELRNYKDIERMPEDETVTFDGAAVPKRQVDPFTASAAAIVRLAAAMDPVITGYEPNGN